MKYVLSAAIGMLLVVGCGAAHAQSAPAAPAVPAALAAPAAPAVMISDFRLQHGEGRVTLDPKLNRIAHDQAAAMAAKDVLDHSVLAPFNTRVASAGYGRIAENIAYGYDGFPKTLDQWIHSPDHRKNLLMPGASRVGIATVRSTTTRRPYWAMLIATEEKKASPPPKTKPAKRAPAPPCRMKIIGLCL